MRSRHARFLAALVCTVLFAAGCASNRYRAPVGSFRDDTQRTIGTIRDFYESRNSYEVELYLNGVAADGTQDVLQKDAKGNLTPIGAPTFSRESVAARLNALDLVGAYAGRLATLASSDAPSKFKDAAALLGTNLSSLDQTFKRLSGGSDSSAKQFITPIANIVGAVGAMVLEGRRDALMTAAIQKGEAPVNEVLGLVRDDLDTIFGAQLRVGEADRMATLVSAYNNDRPKLSYEQRRARLQEIKAAHAARMSVADSVPSALITSMMDAHAALVELARSPRGPANFAEFNDALELWAARVEYLAGQLRAVIR